MTSSPHITVTCPECGHAFPLSEAVLGSLRDGVRKELSADVAKREHSLEKKLTELRTREEHLHKQSADLESEVQKRLHAQLKEAEARARKLAEDSLSLQLKDLETQLAEKAGALRTAQEKELELRRAQRRLKEEREAFEIEMTRKIDGERDALRQKLTAQLEEENRLKFAEREKVITDLRHEMELLQRKAAQGSQQTQGEVMELDLAANLGVTFPSDKIAEISKGVRGADIAQSVISPTGRDCGIILYESKRTKNWSDAWVPKLKEDMRNARAELGVIVTETLPEGVKRFGLVDGVWVTDYASVLPLASSLRFTLQQLAIAKLAQDGAKEKMAILYAYLTGAEFRQRVEGVIDAFTTMKEDLDAEKRALTKHWARREKQLGQVVENMAGMFGDIQGISGSALPDIKSLALAS
jgi:hypothetical protein